MEHLTDFADDRLVGGCIYCTGLPETREHVPSRTFLEKTYPENLPVVGSCKKCNEGFSKDEQYVVCLLESVLAGSTEPEGIRRASVGRALHRAPALRARIESSITRTNGRIVFGVEEDRVNRVMLKLAKGHAVYELSEIFRGEPAHFWCGPLEAMTPDQYDEFSAPHFPQVFGEVGCRNLQRLTVVHVPSQAEDGDACSVALLMNDWIEVQQGFYRYQAISDTCGVLIRIVIADYLACEVAWEL